MCPLVGAWLLLLALLFVGVLVPVVGGLWCWLCLRFGFVVQVVLVLCSCVAMGVSVSWRDLQIFLLLSAYVIIA